MFISLISQMTTDTTKYFVFFVVLCGFVSNKGEEKAKNAPMAQMTADLLLLFIKLHLSVTLL